MIMMNDGYWVRFFNDIEPDYEITGKYLFFSENVNKLLEIVYNEIENYNFPQAKVNKELDIYDKEYVLCLYYKDDSRKHELYKRNKENYNVKYRFWKSNEDTRMGKYSKEFLNRGVR
jgi:hypothetical protein